MHSISANRSLLISLLIVAALAVLWYVSMESLYRRRLFASEKMTKGNLRTPAGNGEWLLVERSGKDVKIPAGNGYVHARVYDDFPGQRFVLFCHGNSGTIADRGYIIELTQILGINLIIFDYRGFGRSKGTLNELTILEDAEAVYSYTIRSVVHPTRLIIWGESLGGSPAVHLARHYECSRLVLMFAFASLRDVAIYADIPDYLRSAITPLLLGVRKNLPNKIWIRDVTAPVLIIHSVDDQMVNIENAKILLNAVQHDRKTLLYIQGAHSSPKIEPEAYRVMSVFLNARANRPHLATDSEVENMDRVLEYHNRHINKAIKEKHL